MEIRKQTHSAVITLALVLVSVAGCGSDEPVATNDASHESAVLAPSIDQVAQVVSLDDEDRAVVAGALEQWQKKTAGSATEPGRPYRAGMEFLATVAPSLDNKQLADLVGLLRDFRDEHRAGLRNAHHAGRAAKARMESLSESLDLSSEQRSAMQAMHSELRNQVRALHEAVRAGTMGAEEMEAALADLHDSQRQKLAGILTKEQLSRLDALRGEQRAQMIDRRLAHMDERVDAHVAWLAAVLGLSAEQQSTLRTALETAAAERKQALESARGGGAASQEFRRLRDQHDAVMASLEKMLTPGQSERLEIVRRLHPRHVQ